MPKKIEFTSKQKSDLEDLVYDGKTYKHLTEEFDVSYKVIRRILEECGLKDQMDENVEKQNREVVAENQRRSARKRYESVDEEFGEEIRDLIENKQGLLKDVSNLIGRSSSFSKNYLQYIGYDKKRQENSRKVQVKKAAKNGAKYALSGKDHPMYRGFSEEVKSWYVDKVNRGWYKWKIYRNLKAKYNYSEGKFYELVEKYEKKPRNYSFEGENNPMYGKNPSKESGYGINGHFKKENDNLIFFRSSLELKVFYDLSERGINFQKCNIRISYNYNGSKKSYLPDIVIDNKIYEIKPEELIERDINQKKKNVLINYCENSDTHVYGGYISGIESDFTRELFFELVDNGKVKMKDEQIDRILNYL